MSTDDQPDQTPTYRSDADQFMKEAASKHTVGLSYYVHIPGQAPKDAQRGVASCFVVEAEGLWFLITAGHVINEIRENTAKGAKYFRYSLMDGFTGHDFKYSIPFPFDLNDWTVIEGDPSGSDHAMAFLRPLLADGLYAGGIRPIANNAWGSGPLSQYAKLALVGIPKERVKSPSAGKSVVGLVLLPLEICDPPSGTANLETENRFFARILEDPENDQVHISDIGGMSGGPIFGVNATEDEITYWVVGIQSRWLAPKRIVSFCAATDFLRAVEQAIRKVRGRSGQS